MTERPQHIYHTWQNPLLFLLQSLCNGFLSPPKHRITTTDPLLTLLCYLGPHSIDPDTRGSHEVVSNQTGSGGETQPGDRAVFERRGHECSSQNRAQNDQKCPLRHRAAPLSNTYFYAGTRQRASCRAAPQAPGAAGGVQFDVFPKLPVLLAFI